MEEQEERRSELRRRNSKKEKKVKEEKRSRRVESPERGMGMMRSKSVGAIEVKQEEEQDPGSLSMWSCRRCKKYHHRWKASPP